MYKLIPYETFLPRPEDRLTHVREPCNLSNGCCLEPKLSCRDCKLAIEKPGLPEIVKGMDKRTLYDYLQTIILLE